MTPDALPRAAARWLAVTALAATVLSPATSAAAAPFAQQGPRHATAIERGEADDSPAAVSADGGTVLVGGVTGTPANPGKGDGPPTRLSSARIVGTVDTNTAGVWTQQGTSFSEPTGASDFGAAAVVALSGDGRTALLADPDDNGDMGLAWVFVRSGRTWTEQGPPLSGAGLAEFGVDVALSADGSTALIGGFGGAFVYGRSGATWSQEGSELTPSTATVPGAVDDSVALAADGSTALIGETDADNPAGAAWAFTRTGSTWTQEGPKITPTSGLETTPGPAGVSFGASVALSSDGTTALIGARTASPGGAWVFTLTGGAFAQQGDELVGEPTAGPDPLFGQAVALSGDGNTALAASDDIGGPVGSGAWVFTRAGGVWTRQAAPLVPVDQTAANAGGVAVALSTDASTALISGEGDVGGPVWTFDSLGRLGAVPAIGMRAQTHAVWRERGSHSRTLPLGTTFSFSLDQRATVRLEFRRVGGAATRSLTGAGHSGRNTVVFDGLVHGRPLRPGEYRVRIIATNAAGISAPFNALLQELTFRIAV